MTSSSKQQQDNDDGPKDHCNLVNVIALLLGTGTLLAYNVLITCSDYLTHEFPSYPRLMFILVPVLCVPNFLGLLFMIRFGHKFSFTLKITLCFILTFVTLVLVPCLLSKVSLDEHVKYAILLGLTGLVGVLTAVLQCSVIAFVSLLPSKYIQTTLAGQAMSGILVCLIRIFTKTYFLNKVVVGGLIYFVIGSVFTCLCAVSFVFLKKTAFVKYHLQSFDTDAKDASDASDASDVLQNEQISEIKVETRKLKNSDNNGETRELLRRMDTPHQLANYINVHEHEQRTNISTNYGSLDVQFDGVEGRNGPKFSNKYSKYSQKYPNNSIQYDSDLMHEQKRMIRKANDDKNNKMNLSVSSLDLQTKISYKTVFPKVKLLCFAIFLNMVITFLFFPSLAISIPSQVSILNKDAWVPVMIVTEFNIGDFIGRKWLSSYSLCWNGKNVWFLSVLRIVVYPVLILLYKGYIVSDVVTHVVMIVASVTNGYINTLCYMWAPSFLSHSREQEIATSLMTTCLLVGIVCGSFVALYLSHTGLM